jgi:hypothetical protein
MFAGTAAHLCHVLFQLHQSIHFTLLQLAKWYRRPFTDDHCHCMFIDNGKFLIVNRTVLILILGMSQVRNRACFIQQVDSLLRNVQQSILSPKARRYIMVQLKAVSRFLQACCGFGRMPVILNHPTDSRNILNIGQDGVGRLGS